MSLRAILALALPLLLAPTAARADSIGLGCHRAPAPGITIDPASDFGACAAFTVRDRKGAVLQRIAGIELGSGTVLTSADGRTALFVQDFPLARIDASGHIRTLAGEALVGVVVLRDGAEVARIALDTLVPDARKAKQSVSHVMWLDSHDPVVGATWRLRTHDGLRFSIDTRTGRLTRR
jgi:hypothetical protein